MQTDQLSNNQGGTTRLANPTAYHMQQIRYKDNPSMGIDPSQMMGNPHLLFAQHQQQQQQQQHQQESPNLSDLDYSEINQSSSSPLTGEFQKASARYRSNDGDYNFDEALKQQHYAYTAQMKRSSTELGATTVGGLAGHPHPQQQQQQLQEQYGKFYQHYYPTPHEHEQNSRLRQFAESAPSNLGVYSPFGNSDDMISVAASQSTQFTSDTVSKKHRRDVVDNNSDLLDDTYNEDYANQANMQAIMEKRRRRRESHNAVERRRRDNINDRIQELGTLLPDVLDDGVLRLNKGTILRKSVEQIKNLQSDVAQYQQRVRELEIVLQRLRQGIH